MCTVLIEPITAVAIEFGDSVRNAGVITTASGIATRFDHSANVDTAQEMWHAMTSSADRNGLRLSLERIASDRKRATLQRDSSSASSAGSAGSG